MNFLPFISYLFGTWLHFFLKKKKSLFRQQDYALWEVKWDQFWMLVLVHSRVNGSVYLFSFFSKLVQWSQWGNPEDLNFRITSVEKEDLCINLHVLLLYWFHLLLLQSLSPTPVRALSWNLKLETSSSVFFSLSPLSHTHAVFTDSVTSVLRNLRRRRK